MLKFCFNCKYKDDILPKISVKRKKEIDDENAKKAKVERVNINYLLTKYFN